MVGDGMGDGIGTGVSGQSANADAQQHNVNATAKNTTATRLRNEEEMEEMEVMAGIISRNLLSVTKFTTDFALYGPAVCTNLQPLYTPLIEQQGCVGVIRRTQ